MRIFIGLTEIAGYYSNLQKGFSQIGVDCTFVTEEDHRFNYQSDVSTNFLVRWLKWCRTRHGRTSRSKPLKRALLFGFLQLIKLALFIWALSTHDVFIFGFNSSFFGFHELPILKMLNKKVLYVFHGSDSRPPYIDGAVMRASGNLTVQNCIEMARKKKETVRKIEKYADIVINSPSWGHFHECPFVSWFFIGLPIAPELNIKKSANTRDPANNSIRILHAPSLPEAKGTEKIREVIENLKNRGFPIEFIEISGKPQLAVFEELVRCDFVIDQLYASFLMAGFAAEAALYGKPAVVGSYYSNIIKHDVPEDKIPPSYHCHPDSLEHAIEKMIVDEKYRVELGKEAKFFVETNWDPKIVAKRYLQLIKGEFPEAWLFDPQKINYLNGGCISENRAREIVSGIIKQASKKALQLSDKPKLEKLFVDFAHSK